jgi:hypothetical protein
MVSWRSLNRAPILASFEAAIESGNTYCFQAQLLNQMLRKGIDVEKLREKCCIALGIAQWKPYNDA